MLSGIAWIILLIACINLMNLATANNQKRLKEVGVRKLLGAGKTNLVSKFMAEALLQSFFSMFLAALFVILSLPAFNQLMLKNLSPGVLSVKHISALLGIAVICGMVAGSYPAFYLSSFQPALVLKGLKIKTGSAALIRKGLVVFQFTVSIVFIISTLIVYLQLQHAKSRSLGFNKNNLIEIDMQHDISGNFAAIKQDLIETGFVQNVAMADHTTIYGGNSASRFNWTGKPKETDVSITFRNVSPEFISTSGMQVVEGRDFRPSAADANTGVIITRSFEKLMGRESAVGKIIQSPRNNPDAVFTNMTVIGVVNDYVYGNMYGEPGPVVFFCKAGTDANLMYV
jgi:ABC-type antimicrobial peptide transport system permease subunit